MTYHSDKICEDWEQPLLYLKKLLKDMEQGEILDAHLAFQGENGICTENIWEKEVVNDMAKDGLMLLTLYSGLEACTCLFE